jgi:hypothetical protein
VSSTLGVNKAWLLHFLKTHVTKGMKTWELKKKFILPWTASFKGPLVEGLGNIYVGRATVFVSHAYSSLVEHTIEAMLRYEEEHPGSVFWFDPFSLNQHPPPGGTAPTDDLIAAFGDRIKEFEATLIVASPWQSPAFLTRSWSTFPLSSFLSALLFCPVLSCPLSTPVLSVIFVSSSLRCV